MMREVYENGATLMQAQRMEFPRPRLIAMLARRADRGRDQWGLRAHALLGGPIH